MMGKDEGVGVNRRQALVVGGAGLLAAGSAASLAQGSAPGKPVPAKETVVTVEDATNVALTVSRDGKTIALDLLGILWTMPIGGGPLKRLTGDFDDLGQPDFSPDGSRIIFQSYRTGNFHIWSVPAAGGPLLQHTSGNCDDREPRWSPDGKSIAFASDRAQGRYVIHLLDVASGTVTALSQGKSNDSEPCWSPDGKRIAYVAEGVKLMLCGLDGVASVAAQVTPSTDRLRPSAIMAPSFAPDGTLAYTRVDGGNVTLVHDGKDVVVGEDLYPFRPGWLPNGGFVYGSGGKVRRMAGGTSSIIPFKASVPVTTPDYVKKTRDFVSTTPKPVVGIVAPALSPDGKRIVFGALNDIWLLPIGGIPKRLIADMSYKVDPAWSPDGKWIAYASDRNGTLDLWLRDMASGKERQLTNLPNQGIVSPAWSQDGKWIACLDQDGALHTIEVATGAVRKLYDGLWEPGRPSFGPDAATIAYAAFKPITSRYREGASEILTVDVASGKGSYAPIASGKSLGVRGLDGPVWSPDGRMMAYIFASTLWIVPVDAKGAFTGPPKQITTDVSDAPSWSGDSKTLLYLSNGVLKLIPASGGVARPVPCRITWANAKPKARTVIRAGKMWDSSTPSYKTNVDVLIEGNQIAAITPAQSSKPEEGINFIDGSALTLMPGLIDMHTHRQMQGYNYGDRMGRAWLAMGVTATRSPGAPAYHMVEDREAIQSGARIAARHFATGEAIDGSRIYYNFMRPVTEAGQMALELSRAKALDYDMVKTYVRLRHDVQKQVIDAAHKMGMHLSTHYHYPALHSGMDGMEHLGATSRYGYSRSITTLGGGYQDVNGLFAAAKAARSPTLFIATALLGEDDAIARDERIKTLFPSWEYAKLMARVKGMQVADRTAMLANLERQVAQIKQTMALGWHVTSGTDAPIDLVAISLHLNLRGMEKYGVSNHDVLLSATRHSGDYLQEPIGRIERGALADLILVDGDPLKRIADAANVEHVIANGFAHTPKSLMVPFTRASASAVENPILPALHAHQHYWWQTAEYVESGRAACCGGHSVLHA